MRGNCTSTSYLTIRTGTVRQQRESSSTYPPPGGPGGPGSVSKQGRPQAQIRRGGGVTRRMARAKAQIKKKNRRQAKARGRPPSRQQTTARKWATQPKNYQENNYQYLSRLGLFFTRTGAQKRGRRGTGVAKRGPGQPDGSSPGPEAKG